MQPDTSHQDEMNARDGHTSDRPGWTPHNRRTFTKRQLDQHVPAEIASNYAEIVENRHSGNWQPFVDQANRESNDRPDDLGLAVIAAWARMRQSEAPEWIDPADEFVDVDETDERGPILGARDGDDGMPEGPYGDEADDIGLTDTNALDDAESDDEPSGLAALDAVELPPVTPAPARKRAPAAKK